MSVIISLDCDFGYKVGGMGTVGDFVLLGVVRDATATLSHTESDATTRASQGWRAMLAVIKELEVSIQIVKDLTDPGFIALQSAWWNRSKIAIAMLDGDLDTGPGLVFDAQIFNFSPGQPLEELSTVDVTFKPTYSPGNPPYLATAGVNASGESMKQEAALPQPEQPEQPEYEE